MPTCFVGPAPGGLHRMVHASLNLPRICLFVCVFGGKGQVNYIPCEVWNTMLKAHANATWLMCFVDWQLKHLKLSVKYWGWWPYWCKRCVPVHAEDGFFIRLVNSFRLKLKWTCTQTQTLDSGLQKSCVTYTRFRASISWCFLHEIFSDLGAITCFFLRSSNPFVGSCEKSIAFFRFLE